jgi:hypothetical protein
MRYLRMFTNSVVGGALGAAYVTLVMLQLNPQYPLAPAPLASLYLTLLAFYGVHLTVFIYALIVLRQVVGAQVLSPGWLSVRILAWLSTGLAAIASLLTWLNLWGLRPTLGDEPARRMASGAAVLAVSAVLLLVIAVGHFSFGRRGSRLSGFLFGITLLASLVIPLSLRGGGRDEPVPGRAVAGGPPVVTTAEGPRVTLILLDGASLDHVAVAAAEGRLPNFGRILDTGSSMYLSTLRPTQPAPVWTAVATGKLPPRNGVRSAARYQPLAWGTPLELLPDYCYAHALLQVGLLRERHHDTSSIRARTLWRMLSDQGVSVGAIGWPLSYPVSPLDGFLVSEHLDLDELSFVELQDPLVAYPMGLVAAARATADRRAAQSETGRTIGQEVSPHRDLVTSALADVLRDRIPVQVLAVRYRDLDTLGHRFLRPARPDLFGDVNDRERRQYGHVLGDAYAFIDERIGEALGELKGDDLLFVVSAFGMEPLSLPKRMLARIGGDPSITGTHERAPDGFLLAYGAAVAAGRRTPGSVADVTPTVLYYLGLPVGRDMDGNARTDLFTPEYTATRPITFIPSYQ